MTLPKRWLEDDDDATSAVRSVLRAGRAMDPPEGAENAVWLGLMGQIGAAGAAGAAAGASGKAAAAGAKAVAAAGAGTSAGGGVLGGGLLKAILIGTFSGIVAVSGYSVIAPAQDPVSTASPSALQIAPSAAADSPSAPNKPVAPSREAAAAPSAAPSAVPATAAPAAAEARDPSQSVSPSAVSASDEPSGAAAATAADSADAATAPLPGSAEERASRLREESEMLGQARAALRGGDTGGAMRLLEQARTRFPGGVLGQEREALTIETLAKSGARDVASARAAAFLKAHPQSPHAARLQAFVQP